VSCAASAGALRWCHRGEVQVVKLSPRCRLLHCRAELDEDLPAHGKHYCTACSRYFMSEEALGTHTKSKPHKKRVKALLGAKPHNQADADWAGGMGAADNGQVSRPMDA